MYKFEKLKVWQLSVSFVSLIYRFCEQLPVGEQRNIIDQLKRAATSVSLNIAEGSAAENDVEFKRFLAIARKSLFECVAILKITEVLYKKNIDVEIEKANEIGKMINSLVKYLSKPKSRV